ncbi:hypothetical protein ACTQXJ_09235 [Collinsella sp. LCP19S3_C6]|uniref:hypothetical protein n=1 Tax=Collinsella sp. LCP19S3_C6 TaxID=3438759 RepID=UPI003F926D85
MILAPLVMQSPPWVDMLVTEVPAGVVSLRVWRVVDGVRVPVRGQHVPLGSSARVVDWDIPVGVPVTYLVEAVSSSGQVVGTGGESVQAVVSPGHSRAWLSDPMAPLGTVVVGVLRSESRGRWSSASEMVRPMGGLPVTVGGARQVRVRSWRLVAEDEATVQAVDRIMLAGPTVLLRGDPECLDHPTGLLYVSAADVESERTVPHLPRVAWQVDGYESRGPAILPVVPSRTYADDMAEHPTYQDSTAAAATYLDRLRLLEA